MLKIDYQYGHFLYFLTIMIYGIPSIFDNYRWIWKIPWVTIIRHLHDCGFLLIFPRSRLLGPTRLLGRLEYVVDHAEQYYQLDFGGRENEGSTTEVHYHSVWLTWLLVLLLVVCIYLYFVAEFLEAWALSNFWFEYIIDNCKSVQPENLMICLTLKTALGSISTSCQHVG